MTAYPTGSPPPPQGYYYEPPPPPPTPEEEGVRTHDGFYLRTGLGFGWGQVETQAAEFEATRSGAGVLFDLLLGGTIGNTVVIGGGFFTHSIAEPEVEKNREDYGQLSDEGTNGIGLLTLGPFVDFYFGPHSGGHVGSMIGLGDIGLLDRDGINSSGYGFALFGGYDFWVSDQWSLGLTGRYMYVKGERELDTIFSNLDNSVLAESPTATDTAHTFGILFGALYH